MVRGGVMSDRIKAIEKEMVRAIIAGRDWGKGNTRVACSEGCRRHSAYIYLHGHHIATVLLRVNGWDDQVIPSLGIPQTRTSLSRLRALALAFTQKTVTHISIN